MTGSVRGGYLGDSGALFSRADGGSLADKQFEDWLMGTENADDLPQTPLNSVPVRSFGISSHLSDFDGGSPSMATESVSELQAGLAALADPVAAIANATPRDGARDIATMPFSVTVLGPIVRWAEAGCVSCSLL